MKKVDIENAITAMGELKGIFDKQAYNISSACNIQYNKVMPILKTELERLNKDSVEINSPKYFEINLTSPETKIKLSNLSDDDINTTIINQLNAKLEDLVRNDYKIIDYGIETTTSGRIAYIKYTN